jgi:hypothetical protein
LLDKNLSPATSDLLSLPVVHQKYLLCLVNLLPAAVTPVVSPTLTRRYSRLQGQKRIFKKYNDVIVIDGRE